MSHTRMWIMEMDQYGATDRKFYVDDPLHVPRIGEFVDSDTGGWVDHVQYRYNLDQDAKFGLVMNVYLRKEK